MAKHSTNGHIFLADMYKYRRNNFPWTFSNFQLDGFNLTRRKKKEAKKKKVE
ncbi:hypothetical protein [Okeania sp. SIO1I7]|uniref:hypothetical protein n=1 Tax=Okeania sp. SIO1I7 TaxID=2607772 RepID=UPI0013FAB43A|nr:hypothetical protein [Okeania sp. SIO1I7]NET25903.1 hypothetical protein [Okeania sp. SIO1I7]